MVTTRWRRVVWAALAVLLVGLFAWRTAARQWEGWVEEGRALGRAHHALEQTHPGWSFPGKIVTSAVPVDAGLSVRRLIAEAKARGYEASCAERRPGSFCETKSWVEPRDGGALEPIELGALVGPDAELRTHLPLSEAPKALVELILVAEDREFRSHRGVNVSALARAVWRNVTRARYSQGASTLTMQVVRALTQQTEKKLSRKLREMGLAVGLEAELGKDAVLGMYLDTPYLGQRRGGLSVCGFSEAARHYFGADVRRLSLAQLALLVAILPSPRKLGPVRAPVAAKARRDQLLKDYGKLHGVDVTAALAEPMTLAPEAVARDERFPAYVSAVRQHLEAALPPAVLYGTGLVVEAAVDVPLQADGEALFPAKALAYEEAAGITPKGTLQAVGVAVDVESGALKAVYGGHGLTGTGFNRATQAHRQPGSSFKPVVYALAFSQTAPDGGPRFTAASTEPNSPRVFKTPRGDWRPYNVSGEASPTAALAEGLAWSQNIATASLLEHLGGPAPLKAFANEAGFDTSAYPDELGLALGQAEVTPLEMARFMATIANGGRRVDPSPVVSAIDLRGTQRVGPPKPAERVLTPEAAALTRDVMRLVIEYGTGGAARGLAGEAGYFGPAIGKTGTTDSERDIWFVGSTPKLAAAVWLGFDQPARIGAAAADFAAPLWGWWLGRRARLEAPPWPDFSKEPKLLKQAICTETGLVPNLGCRAIPAPFIPGTQPKAQCTVDHAAQDAGPAHAHESFWKKRQRILDEADGGRRDAGLGATP